MGADLAPGALPVWMTEAIKRAELLFNQARFEDMAGNHATAELLRDQAEQIYNELETGQAGQPGPQALTLGSDPAGVGLEHEQKTQAA